jgi:hypothetical protein
MSDTIWFQLADCLGHALAKRWLARRAGPLVGCTPDTARLSSQRADAPEGSAGPNQPPGDPRPGEDNRRLRSHGPCT